MRCKTGPAAAARTNLACSVGGVPSAVGRRRARCSCSRLLTVATEVAARACRPPTRRASRAAAIMTTPCTCRPARRHFAHSIFRRTASLQSARRTRHNFSRWLFSAETTFANVFMRAMLSARRLAEVSRGRSALRQRCHCSRSSGISSGSYPDLPECPQ